MPTRIIRECWNCGKSYDPDESKNCPYCGEYPDDEPDYEPEPESLFDIKY